MRQKLKITPNTPKNETGLTQLIMMGKSIHQIWVKYFQTDVTVPLYQKALRKDIDLNIVKLLQTVLPDSREHEEKDSVSLQNTI